MSKSCWIAVAVVALAAPAWAAGLTAPAHALPGDPDATLWTAPAPAAGAGQPTAATSSRKQEREVRRQVRETRKRETSRSRAVQEARETRTFKAGPDTTISISNLAGDISVTGGSSHEVRVEIVRRAYGADDEDARRQLESTAVDIEQRGSRIDLRARHANSHGRVEVAFTVAAPKGVLVDARSLSGDIKITGLDGEARVETMSGDILATGLGALSSAKTMSGDVELTNCTYTGEMTASSVSGGLTVRAVKARSCSFGSISGEVGLTNAACERAVVRSVSGDVAFAGPIDRGGRYEFKSHSGNVVVTVDGKTGFEINARTYSGRLRSDLPLTGGTGTEPSRASRRGTETLSGLFGDGSAEISVTTFSGNVTLTRK